MKRLERRFTPFALSFLAILVVAVPGYAMFGHSQAANADSINPLTLVPHDPTVEEDIVNPHPTWGDIESLDAIDNGEKLGVLFDSGKTAIYNSDMSSQLQTLDFGITGATGFTEVPLNYFAEGAKYAVSDIGGIFFFDAGGSYLGAKNIITPSDINEIDWDSAFGRMLVGNDGGTYKVKEDGTLDLIKIGGSGSIEAINMDPEYYDMFAQNRTFNVLDTDGSWKSDISGLVTTYSSGISMRGMAFTQLNGFTAGHDIIIKYEKAPFQDHMIYEASGEIIPEPGTLALLGAGATFLLAAAANRFRKQNGIYVPKDMNKAA